MNNKNLTPLAKYLFYSFQAWNEHSKKLLNYKYEYGRVWPDSPPFIQHLAKQEQHLWDNICHTGETNG